ncbi:MAG: FHA domain-containing protein [Caldilineaceae bacterium]|nr:FHA domain-containing protein [Caldilineaceae bacterium]
MTVDRLRIYYNAILGALGGLIGWALITLLLRFETSQTFLLLLRDALFGALVGGCIGFAVGSAEQLAGRLRLPNLHQSTLSAAIGAGAGLIGLVSGELIFLLAGGGVWPRALGWALFGALLGLGQWRVTGMPSKGSYGALGGLFGGLLGGSTYERLTLLLLNLELSRALALSISGAVGLMILGACIGALIGLVEDILRTAWLRFTRGRLEGQTRTLDPRRAQILLGGADRCDIVLPDDPDVARTHAEIVHHHGQFTIVSRDGSVLLRRATETMTATIAETIAVQQHVLQPGDTIQLGRTRFIFQTDAGERA